MTSNDLIYCADRVENLRKALHKKDKMSPYDCEEYRIGVLDVLCVLGFITDPEESLNIINKAGAWDKDLRLEAYKVPVYVMRQQLNTLYNGAQKWLDKVKRMSDDQVVAVYYRMKRDKKL